MFKVLNLTLHDSTCNVRMAERSKALRSGRSPLLWAWVRIPLLTRNLLVGFGASPSPLLLGQQFALWPTR